MANEYEDPEDLIAQQEAEESGRIVAAEKARREAEEKKDETMGNELLDWAIWTARNLGPIIPTAPYGEVNDKGKPSKEPCGKLVPHGSKDATTDEATIRRWYDEEPRANIGFVGASAKPPIFVIDIDVHDGVDGFANIAKAGYTLPDTLQAETPSGGKHYFYKWTQGEKPRQTQSNIRDDNGEKILGVDVRGVNGYVVVAPSRTTAGQYKWLNNSFDDLAEFPEWAKRVGAKPKKMTGAQDLAQDELPTSGRIEGNEAKKARLDAFLHGTPPPSKLETSRSSTVTDDEKRRRASAYLAKIPPAVQGGDAEGMLGHDRLLYVCIRIAVGFDLDDATALKLLWSEYNPRCVPPWNPADDKELKDFERKVSEARKKANEPPGFLLYAERPQKAIAATDEPDIDDTTESDKAEDLDWSKLIEELPGLVGEIARYALSSMIRPQPKFAVLIALVTVATVYNRTVHDPANNIARIFGMAICPNGGGKDPVLKIPPAIIEAAFRKLGWHAQLIMSKAHSESAIADALSFCPVRTMLIDEVSGFFKQAKAAEKNGASVATVKGMLKTLYSFKLRETYEGAKNARVQGKSLKRIRVDTPCVSFAGVTQDDMLPDAFQEADIKDGLLPRNIFFISETRPRKNYDVLANRPPIPEAIIDAVAEVFRMQHWEQADKDDPNAKTYSYAYKSFPLRATAEALARQREYGESCDNRFEEMDAAGKLTASIWVRADENARGVALVIAAGRAGVNLNGAEIVLADVEFAIRIVTACAKDSCRFLEGRITDDRFDALKVKIRRFIGKAGEAGRTQTEITRGKFGDPKFRDLAIKEEVSAGYVKAGQVCRNGRTADAYFITKRGAASL